MPDKILKIEWDDTRTQDDCTRVAKCRSVGFLIKETKKAITLAATMQEDSCNCQYITIPKGCVTDIQELK